MQQRTRVRGSRHALWAAAGSVILAAGGLVACGSGTGSADDSASASSGPSASSASASESSGATAGADCSELQSELDDALAAAGPYAPSHVVVAGGSCSPADTPTGLPDAVIVEYTLPSLSSDELTALLESTGETINDTVPDSFVGTGQVQVRADNGSTISAPAGAGTLSADQAATLAGVTSSAYEVSVSMGGVPFVSCTLRVDGAALSAQDATSAVTFARDTARAVGAETASCTVANSGLGGSLSPGLIVEIPLEGDIPPEISEIVTVWSSLLLDPKFQPAGLFIGTDPAEEPATFQYAGGEPPATITDGLASITELAAAAGLAPVQFEYVP